MSAFTLGNLDPSVSPPSPALPKITCVLAFAFASRSRKLETVWFMNFYGAIESANYQQPGDHITNKTYTTTPSDTQDTTTGTSLWWMLACLCERYDTICVAESFIFFLSCYFVCIHGWMDWERVSLLASDRESGIWSCFSRFSTFCF